MNKFGYKNTLKIHSFGEEHEVFFGINSYANNGNVAINVITTEGEPWQMLTVNIGKLPYGYACLDTNNTYSDIIEVLEEKGLIKSEGIYVPSGFCSYPVYHLSDDFLSEWCVA